MMKSKTLLKEMWMLLAILFCSITSANAATITYSLTTHVDGRTITGTADLQGGASLEDNMPQELWRGYTTYKYYADQDLTKEITTAPNENATVYVDYVFDPPFLMSDDASTKWVYFRAYNETGDNRFVYFREYIYNYDKKDYITTAKEQPTAKNQGNMTLKYRENAQWAFYGDGYSLNLKFNDVANITENDFLIPGTSATSTLRVGSEMAPVGWQLYENTASNSKLAGGFFSLINPENGYIISIQDLAAPLKTLPLNDGSLKYRIDNKGRIVMQEGQGYQKRWLFWSAFFATPTYYDPGVDMWHTTYKIQKADGSWYNDIVITKKANNLTPTFPPTGFTPQEGYTYEYFFKDANFKEKYAEGYTMPNNENTILYIIEKMEEVPGVERTFTVGKWMTLVLPDYNLLPQNGIYGKFLDYVAVESKENAEDGYHWDCDLKFEEVDPDDLIPNRPYLYLPTQIEGTDDNVRDKVVKFNLNGTPEVVSHVDPAQPDVTVSMYGTYEDFELVPCQPVEPKGYKYIYFYFGNPAEDVYNFYTVDEAVTIKPTICYFDIKATKNANPTIGGFGAKFAFFDGTNAISNIEGVKKSSDKVYNLNGQQVQGNLQKGIYIVNGKKVLVK